MESEFDPTWIWLQKPEIYTFLITQLDFNKTHWNDIYKKPPGLV